MLPRCTSLGAPTAAARTNLGKSTPRLVMRAGPLHRSASSFIARAKEANDPSVLLGQFLSAGHFDACLENAGLTTTKIDASGVECEIMVTEALANNYGTLHGGCISTIVDVVGTLALLGIDPTRAGVSVDMNQTFCSAARVGDRLSAVGTVSRYGKSLGFTEVTLRMLDGDGETGKVVAIGRHTKFFPAAR